MEVVKAKSHIFSNLILNDVLRKMVSHDRLSHSHNATANLAGISLLSRTRNHLAHHSFQVRAHTRVMVDNVVHEGSPICVREPAEQALFLVTEVRLEQAAHLHSQRGRVRIATT